jgi:rhodanese-related sulfurtransferase
MDHASYYAGAMPISMKLLFDPTTGRALGAQAVGERGADKRIDVLATAIQAGLNVRQIAQLELGYAPPYGSARDPVNIAAMAAENLLNGDVEGIHWNEIEALDPDRVVFLDVRDRQSFSAGSLPGALNIPLTELRSRLSELPKDKEIVVSCRSGQQSYYACRILTQHGFRARNLSGAYMTWAPAACEYGASRKPASGDQQ